MVDTSQMRDLLAAAGVGGDATPDATGDIWFVDSVNGDNNADGSSVGTARATIASALASAAAGDTIKVLEGHAETLTAVTTLSLAGLKLEGQGVGARRPAITFNAADDGFDVQAASIVISGFLFNEATSVTGGAINVGGVDCVIKNCQFDLGANDAEAITVEAAGDNLIVEDCFFNVTANGPSAAIEIEANTVDGVIIRGNFFKCSDGTNAFDTAAINSTVAHTNCQIYSNTFTHGIAVVVATSVSTSMWDNDFGVACRPSAATPLTIYAEGARTTVGDGTLRDPTTIVDAVNRATVSGDVVILNGVATVTTALLMDSAGVTLMAAYPGGAEIANDTDDAKSVLVTAARCRIKNVLFTKGAANSSDGTELVDVNAGGDYLLIEDCIFDLETRANADGINIATGLTGVSVTGCLFTDPATVKSMISHAGSACRFTNNTFDFSAADAIAFDQISTPGGGNVVKNNVIISDDTTAAVMGWDGSPLEQACVDNWICSVGATTSAIGSSDANKDPWMIRNWIEGAAGIGVATDPSV